MCRDLSNKSGGVSKGYELVGHLLCNITLSQGFFATIHQAAYCHYILSISLRKSHSPTQRTSLKLQQLCKQFPVNLKQSSKEICSQLTYTKAERIQFVCVQWGVYATRLCKHSFVCARLRLQEAN